VSRFYEKPDYWALKAQREGYPARSVYKFTELDGKFGLLRTGSPPRVLELGAAPGSWSLYMLRNYRVRAGVLLAAADCEPLNRRFDRGLFDRSDFFFIRGDITADATRRALLERGPYTAVLSDAAPATTGNRTVDAARSRILAGAALDYADAALSPGGNLAVKIFQGDNTAELLARLRERFRSARCFKPKACRDSSFETYLIGLGKR
jgi:23S rRNA (uridine2552-2'-O)-methyltransferase